MRRLLLALTAASMTMMASPTRSEAGLIPIYLGNINLGPSNYLWSYSVTLQSGYQLRNGDFFTIYDFAGYIPGTASILSFVGPWSISVSNVGTTPPSVVPFDDPNIPNLTFTYMGTSTINPVQYFLVMARSTYGDEVEGAFAARSTVFGTNTGNSNLTTTYVPNAPTPRVPEPTTFVLLGTGLLAVGIGRRLRQ